MVEKPLSKQRRERDPDQTGFNGHPNILHGAVSTSQDMVHKDHDHNIPIMVGPQR